MLEIDRTKRISFPEILKHNFLEYFSLLMKTKNKGLQTNYKDNNFKIIDFK